MQDAPESVLIIRPSALGDVCRTVPVLVSLRRAFPEARIDWLVRSDFAPVIEAHPALDRVVGFPRDRFARWWFSPRQAIEIARWASALRRNRYDLVLDCQGLGRSGLMTRATGAPRRVGLRFARELGWLGYNIRVPRLPSDPVPPHTVDQMMLLVEGLGIEPVHDMRLYVAAEHQEWWRRHRTELGLDGGRYAVLAPTSRWASKRWPIDRFAQLVEPLLERGFERVVLIGAPSEVDQVRLLAESSQMSEGARSQLLNFAGATTIGQTMAVIAQTGLVVANDSAPLHMAVGFDRPCVGLFGPTDPAVVGPYRREDAVVRGWSGPANDSINFKAAALGDRLMRLISTAAVLERVDLVLAREGAATRVSAS